MVLLRVRSPFLFKGETMKCYLILVLLMPFSSPGCSGRVATTEDSVKVEGEVPKVEVGDAPVDLDPRTDDDVDIDTPAPGDQ
jgi:hypothetical protein